MGDDAERAATPRPTVDAGRLWAGGLATALVAALIAIVGIAVVRGVFGVPILAPEGEGTWGDASTVWYALAAALAALLATALAHGLILSTPQPLRFFGWVVALATVIAVVGPFTSDASVESKFATAVVNAIIGIAIGSLVASVARAATRSATRRRREPPG